MNFKLLAIDAADTQRQSNRMHQFQPSFPAGFQNENDRRQFEMREVIQCEIKRERIRMEIIAEEMARRRVLENSVLTDFMMGRLNGGRFPLQAGHSNIFEPRCLNSQPIGLEERIIMAIDEKNRLLVPPFQRNGGSVVIKEIDTPISEDSKKEVFRCETRGFAVSPFERCGDAVKINDSLSQLPEANKKEVIVLGNPNGETLSGTKRKSTSLVGEESNESHLNSSKKKMKGEWSCAICQVSATSERSLNYHIQGKKHQAKEANLIADITGSNFGLGVLPKKQPTVKPVKLSLKTVHPRFRVEKMPKTKGFNMIPSTSKTSSVYVSNITKEDADSENKSDKFKFWCEMCQVGTHSEKVMNAHKVGKKHVRLHRKGKVESKASDIDNEEKNKTGIVEMVAVESKTFKDVNEIVAV